MEGKRVIIRTGKQEGENGMIRDGGRISERD